MPRRPAAVTQADVARAIRAVRDAGVRAAVEIKPDGTIRIPTDLDAEPPVPQELTENVEPEKVIVF